MKDESCYELLQTQKRIWFIDKINADSSVNNIGGSVRIYGDLDYGIFAKTIQTLIYNHDTLRLRIHSENGNAYQYIAEYNEEEIDYLDFSDGEDGEEKYHNWSQTIISQKILLEHNKLYYFGLCKIKSKEYRLLFVGHHIAVDGWSIGILQRELCRTYDLLKSQNDVNKLSSDSIAAWVEKDKKYSSSERYKRDKDYWAEKMNRISEENYYNSFSDLKGQRKTVQIPMDIYNEMNQFLSVNKISPNILFSALLYLYMYKTSNIETQTLGIPIYNRSGLKEKNTIGMLTSTMLCAVTIDAKDNFESYLQKVREEIKNSMYHQKYPYNSIIESLDIEKLGYNSLFKHSINYYNFKLEKGKEDIIFEVDEMYSGEQTYALQIIVKQWEDSHMELSYDYKTAEYTANEINIMHGCIMNLLRQIMKNPNVIIKDLQLIEEEEQAFKITALNSTKVNYPSDKSFIDLFVEQALKTPHNIAVECNGEKITYHELDLKSNQMAEFLKESGVKKQSIVSVIINPSIELFVCILAILKQSAIYLPIDVMYPIDRIRYELEDSGSIMLLTDQEGIEDNVEAIKVVNISNMDVSKYSNEHNSTKSDSEDIAYIIYTSGSTGKPKGVLIKHSGLVNYLCWANKVYLKDSKESMPLFTSIAFDLTVTTIFAPLISGHKVICYPHKSYENILEQIMDDNNCTVMKLTPSHLKLLVDRDNKNLKLRRLIVGGEDLKVNLAQKIEESFGNNIEIYNEYGPTETVVGCMVHQYKSETDNKVSVPLGYAADNVQLYILNKDYNIMPDGVKGELYISGDGVAKGYLNQKELTDKSFLNNPFCKDQVMYRTYDAVRYIENGKIEYIGRTDNQIKIHGYRIEIGEIEKHLQNYESVKDAFVICRTEENSRTFLDAYIVSEEALEISHIKSWLSKFLPHYMIPSRYFFIEEIPLTANGKIDYHLLPEQSDEKIICTNPKSELEEQLIATVKDILKVDAVNLSDNFYYIGGDSITAIQVASKLKERNYFIEVKDILMSNTIAEISEKIESQAVEAEQKVEVYEGYIENTPILDWFWDQDFEQPDWYHQFLLLEMDMKYDKKIVHDSIKYLLNSEEVFRVGYDEKAKKLYYGDILQEEQFVVTEYYMKESDKEEEYKELKEVRQKLSSDIKLEDKGLYRYCIIHRRDGSWAVLFVLHHLIVDGVSWRNLIDAFVTVLRNNGMPVKRSYRSSYKTWSEKLIEYSNGDLTKEEDYWNNIDLDDKGYAADFEGVVSSSTVETLTHVSLNYNINEINELIVNARKKLNVDLNEVMLMCLGLTIKEQYDKEHIVIEYESHGREPISDQLDISKTIGWFTSIFPISLSMESSELEVNLKNLKEQIKKAICNGFSYSVLKYLKSNVKKNRNRYIRYNYLGNLEPFLKQDEIKQVEFGMDSSPANHITSIMDLEIVIKKEELNIKFEYSREDYREETINRFISLFDKNFKCVMEYFLKEPSKQLSPSDFQSVDLSFEDLDNLFL